MLHRFVLVAHSVQLTTDSSLHSRTNHHWLLATTTTIHQSKCCQRVLSEVKREHVPGAYVFLNYKLNNITLAVSFTYVFIIIITVIIFLNVLLPVCFMYH